MRNVFLLFLFFLPVSLSGREYITVMFYNTENLFDTTDDPDKDDDEFTPDGSRRWTKNRYWNKIGNISKVIAAVNEDTAPDIIGLCEVENDSVMIDLTLRSPLRHLGYRYIMTESADTRGIDVAFMYRRSSLGIIGYESLPVDLTYLSPRPTRDILHVTGRIPNGDTIDFYLCHWPSRTGGVEETEPLRMRAAATLRHSVDSLFAVRRKPYVVIMGDLNGGLDSPSIREGLGAVEKSRGKKFDDRELVTMMDDTEEGSYRYQGEWDKYDQFVVSGSLLNGDGFSSVTGVSLFSADFMLEDDEKFGGRKPMRTYNGYIYQNGFSDHLPILLFIEF